MDNKSTTKRMIGAVVLVLIAALLLAWLLKGKNRSVEQKDLIAEQTQESTPILGFPGVKDEQNPNGLGSLGTSTASTDPALATNSANPAAPADGNQEYVIGGTNPNAAAGTNLAGAPAANAAGQGVLGAPDPNASVPIADPNAATGTGAANATGTTIAGVGAAISGAVAGAVESGKQAVQGLTEPAAKGTTDFQVRDTGNGEVRQVVENGQKQPGLGNMGANATVTQEKTKAAAAEEVATSKPATATEAPVAQPTAAATEKAKAVAAEKPVANASTKDRPAVVSGDLKPENPRLVNERPVPAPAAQPRRTVTATTTTTTRSAERPVAARPAVTATTNKPEAKPAPAPVASASNGYVIQVLATSDKAKADNIKSTIGGEGYPVFVTSAKVDGKTVYRVRVGTYPGKGDAAAVQARMKARYGQNQYVQNSFVTKN